MKLNKISIKKLLAVCLAITALISALAAPASAAGYTPIKGGEATFNKYLIVDEKANVPNVTFSYEIAPGTAISATTSTVEVLPGVSGATVGTAAFSANDTKLTEKAAGDTVTLDSGENYVKKTVTLDFTACSFDEPGIYRYILTEQETGGAMGITYDTQKGDELFCVHAVVGEKPAQRKGKGRHHAEPVIGTALYKVMETEIEADSYQHGHKGEKKLPQGETKEDALLIVSYFFVDAYFQ